MLTVAAFAVICLLAVTFFFKKLWATEVVQIPAIPARTMPMAITEIEPGTVITLKHIGNGPVGSDEKLAPDTIMNLNSLVGRVAKEKIPSAVPLEGSMFYAIGDFPGLQIDPRTSSTGCRRPRIQNWFRTRRWYSIAPTTLAAADWAPPGANWTASRPRNGASSTGCARLIRIWPGRSRKGSGSSMAQRPKMKLKNKLRNAS